jgi:hypothetical protein
MMVRVPDAAGQLRNAPVRLLRVLFAGIGQLLLAADRRHAERGKHERYGDDDQLGPPTGLDGVPATQASAQVTMPAKRSFDSTGNVRLLTPDDPAESLDNIRRPKPSHPRPRTARLGSAKPKRDVTGEAKRTTGARHSAGKHRAGTTAPAPPSSPTASASSRTASASSPTASASSLTAAVSSAAAQADLLMPGYESLSVPAIRARLRGLDEPQLRILLACEKSSANRADIVTMFERRIARLEAAERDAT